MEVRVAWCDEIRKGEEAGLRIMEISPIDGDGECVIIEKEFFNNLIRCWSRAGYPYVEPARIKVGYSTQCPDCGFVQSGFDTEEEAVAWECSECLPTLPGMESPTG